MKKKIIVIIFLIILLAFGALFLLFMQLWNNNDKVLTTPKNQVAAKTSMEMFNSNLDEYSSYSFSTQINLKSDKKKYAYNYNEEYSSKGLYLENKKVEEYIKKNDDDYTHFFILDGKKVKENIHTDDISFLHKLKNIKFEETDTDEEIIYSADNINLVDNYNYELHDFVRMITKKSTTQLSGNVSVKYFFSKDTEKLSKVEVDATEAVKEILDNSSISECKIVYDDIEFINGLDFSVPKKYSDVNKVKEKYKDFNTTGKEYSTKPTTKPKNTFEYSDSYNNIVFNGLILRIGSSRLREAENSGIQLSFTSTANGYYAISTSNDHIQFTLSNPYTHETNAEDCIISGLYYMNNGYNQISSIGGIQMGSSINTLISQFGEPDTIDNGWYCWSGSKTLKLYAPSGIISGVQI